MRLYLLGFLDSLARLLDMGFFALVARLPFMGFFYQMALLTFYSVVVIRFTLLFHSSNIPFSSSVSSSFFIATLLPFCTSTSS